MVTSASFPRMPGNGSMNASARRGCGLRMAQKIWSNFSGTSKHNQKPPISVVNSKGNPIFVLGNLYRLVKYVKLVQKWNQDSSKIHCYPVLLGERSRSPAMMYFPAKRGAKRLPESSNQRVDGIIKWDPSLGGSNETTKQALGVFKGIFKISQRNQSA